MLTVKRICYEEKNLFEQIIISGIPLCRLSSNSQKMTLVKLSQFLSFVMRQLAILGHVLEQGFADGTS